MKPLLTLLILGTALLYSTSQAADIYRWVDESGKIHFSDVVPEKYRKSARKMTPPQQAPSEEQRKEAEARAAQDKERAEKSAEKARADGKKAPSQAAAPQSPPKPAVDENTDCATLHRLYRESLDCFAPYISAAGTTKAEAFEKCTPVPDPSPKCGPAK